MVDSSGRSTFPERKAGVGPGSQLRPNVTDLPEAELKKLGVKNPITITDRGVSLILKMMQETGLGVQGSLVQLQKRLDAFRKANPDRTSDLGRYITQAFPDGIEGTQKSLTESRAYEQFLYDNGFLRDADPDFKQLDEKFKSLPKSGQNRRSRQGREILDIKDRGGVPVVVGRDKDGKPIEDPSRSRPYNLDISDKGIEEAKKVSLPVYAQTEITPQIEMQDRQRKAVARREARVPSTVDTSSIPGGETVEPNRGEVSRKAKGAVIVRSDVNTFKQAMGKAVSKGGKVNLFTEIVDEARKIDPKVSMNAMQDIKDYLFFTGHLEADAAVSEKMGPSRLSDADVPEYVKPSQKYYKQGLKVLDAGGSNEPLVIRKLSAEPDPYVQDVRAKSVPEITGPQSATPDRPVSERTSRLLNIIKSGGRKGLKVLVPGVGLAATAVEEAAASTPTARSAFSEIQYDRVMEEAKREELIPEESEVRGRTMEEVKSRTSFMNQ